MRIILCNKYFFLNGGTEKYLANIMGQLSRMGHEPVPFSVGYGGGWESPYSRYFLPPPGDPDQARFEDIRLRPASLPKFIGRCVYSFEARRRLARLLHAAGGADGAYLLNIYNYMSPSIIHTFKKNNIPVVMRLGDYNLLCPAYLFLRGGKPCTRCIRGAYFHGVVYRCVKNSLGASALRCAAMAVHRMLRIYRLVDAFVVPCEFMRTKLEEGGFPGERVHVIRSPVAAAPAAVSAEKGGYILFFGRVSHEKGLDMLIRAYQKLSPAEDLVIAGRSYDGESERLQRLVAPEHAERIRFVGFKNGEELSRLISGALLSVVPSRWYDNAPLSVNESFTHGTPVLAAGIGGIPEQIQAGINGKLFSPESEESLVEALEWMLSDRERLKRMGEAGRERVARNLSLEKHTEAVLGLFERVKSGSEKNC